MIKHFHHPRASAEDLLFAVSLIVLAWLSVVSIAQALKHNDCQTCLIQNSLAPPCTQAQQYTPSAKESLSYPRHQLYADKMHVSDLQYHQPPKVEQEGVE